MRMFAIEPSEDVASQALHDTSDEVMVERPRRHVPWAEILAYARSFPEFELIRLIRSEADIVHVPLGDLTRRGRGRAVPRFGPLSVGDVLGGAWHVAALWLADDCLRVDARRSHELVTFGLTVEPDGRRSGPFDDAPLRVWYEDTPTPYADFRAVGEHLRDRVAAAAGRRFDEAWRDFRAELDAPSRPVAAHALDDSEELQIRADGKLYLRVTDACQERCVFCFFYDTKEVENLVRHHTLDDVIAAVDPTGIRQVVLTGGEPTLHPRLPEYVRMLVDRGFEQVILQTNGIRLAEPGYLEQLLPFRDHLGLGFSLHAASEETNDALTTVAKGYFARKLAAVERAAALGFGLKVLLVLNRHNLAELSDFVELAARINAGTDAVFQFSLPSFQGRMNLFLDTYPRLEELALALPPALRRARELGLRLAFCHQCQIPPCVLPDDLQHLESLWFQDSPRMWDADDRVYGPGCDGCAMRPHCSGLWKGYADHFGTAALSPFAPDEVPSRVEGG